MGKQTRRSVSFSGELYQVLRDYCQKNSTTMSAVVENEMRRFLHMERKAGAALPISPVKPASEPELELAPVVEAKPEKPAPTSNGSVVNIKRDPGNVFTF